MNKTSKIISMGIQIELLKCAVANMNEDHAKVEDSLRTSETLCKKQQAYIDKLERIIPKEILSNYSI
jgi:hypothetical protein